jgi:hypothetical protein
MTDFISTARTVLIESTVQLKTVSRTFLIFLLPNDIRIDDCEFGLTLAATREN